MKTLLEALGEFRDNGCAARTIKKHLAAAGIDSWEQLDRAGLYRFRDTVTGAVSSSTARVIFLNFKSFLTRNIDCVTLPDDWKKILNAKSEKVLRAYLTPEELRRFEDVATKTPAEAVVKVECLLEAYTGARVSDIMALTAENVQDGKLTYVSKKTKVQSTVPCGRKVLRWIVYAQAHREDEPTATGRGKIIRKLCKNAGIDSPVTVFTAGETRKGPKWEFVSSHSFRISFVTNLQQSGVDLVSISRLAGHTNVAMTERYCAPAPPKLTWLAQEFLGLNDE